MTIGFSISVVKGYLSGTISGYLSPNFPVNFLLGLPFF
jgi:hypothetical protein